MRDGIVPVMEVGNNGSNGNNNGFGNGFGGEWSWMIIILFLFVFCGWGNGFGGNRGNGGNGDSTILPYLLARDNSGAQPNYVLTSDFAQIDRKLDGIANGICDSTFALNNTMTNGFAGVQQTLCQGFGGVNQAIVQNGYETRLGVQGLSSQLSNCLNRFFIAVKNHLQKVNTVGSIV